jgi:hypothetical protein
MTEAEMAQIQAEVMEWADTWMDGWNTGTPEDRCAALQALVHPDHVVYLTGGAAWRKADYFDYCTGAQERWRSFTGSWTETDVRVLSPDAAVFVGRFEATWVRDDETIFAYPAGAQLILAERTADGWGATLMEWSNGPRERPEEG